MSQEEITNIIFQLKSIAKNTSKTADNTSSSGSSGGTLIEAVKGVITSGYGGREAPMPGASTNHKGVDIGADYGTPIVATREGISWLAKWLW